MILSKLFQNIKGRNEVEINTTPTQKLFRKVLDFLLKINGVEWHHAPVVEQRFVHGILKQGCNKFSLIAPLVGVIYRTIIPRKGQSARLF